MPGKNSSRELPPEELLGRARRVPPLQGEAMTVAVRLRLAKQNRGGTEDFLQSALCYGRRRIFCLLHRRPHRL